MSMRLHHSVFIIVGLICALSCNSSTPEPIAPPTQVRPEVPDFDSSTWHLERTMYQLAVRMFQDSDGDGQGDLTGIVNRLPYLQNLRIGTLLLDAIQPTSFTDGNRAVSDFVSIADSLGTLDDLKTLIQSAHDANIKITLTLPVNHTDAQHPWFQAALANTDSEPGSWYQLGPTPGSDCTDVFPSAPDVYRDQRWEQSESIYFYHRFSKSSPDLNLTNAATLAAVKDAIKFWLDLGIDGLYFPYSFAWIEDGTTCENTQASRNLATEIRKVFDSYPGTVFITADQYPRDERQAQPSRTTGLIGDGNRAHLVLDSDVIFFMHGLADNSFPPAGYISHLDDLGLDSTLSDSASVVLPTGIREQARVGSVYNNDNRLYRLMFSILFSTKQVPLIFYGDEIAIGHTPSSTIDVRDFYRPPMPWTVTGPVYGFSEHGTPVADAPLRADTYNVQSENSDEGSILTIVKTLIDLRNGYRALSRGSLESTPVADQFTGSPLSDVFGLIRNYENETIVVIHNLAAESRDISINLAATSWPASQKIQDLLDPDTTLPDYAGPDGPSYRLTLNPKASVFLSAVSTTAE